MAKKASKAAGRGSRAVERDVERAVLDNGVRVISERVKGAPAVVFSAWVDAGARYEELNESGATHLIQQLAFAGTENRNEAAIAKAIDKLGGQVEVESARDYGLYQATVEAGQLGKAAELIADLALHPVLGKSDAADEKAKLLEQLRAEEKDADLVLSQMFLRSLWKGHGLCRNPRGRLLTVKGHTRLEDIKSKRLQRFHVMSHYPRAITVVVAGDVTHAKALDLAETHFGALEEPKKTVSTTTPPTHKFLALRNRPQFTKVRFRIGFPTCSASDKLRHSAAILRAVIADGPGSRLARMLKAKELPALGIDSASEMHGDVGCLSIGMRTTRKDAVEVLEKTVEQLRGLAADPLEAEELDRAKARCRAELRSQLDSLSTRAASLARDERYFGRYVPYQEEVAELEAVSADKLQILASNWITPYSLSLAVLGDLKGVQIQPKTLRW